MVRETKQKQLQTTGLINKQMITKITNMLWVWDALAFRMFGKNLMLVFNFVKVSMKDRTSDQRGGVNGS
jgi:hypothetical protein